MSQEKYGMTTQEAAAEASRAAMSWMRGRAEWVLRRKRAVLPLFAAVWLSVSFLGYGLALKQHASYYVAGMNLPNPGGDGVLAWTDTWLPRVRGVRFRLEGVSTVFTLFPEFVNDPSFFSKMSGLFVPGKRVSFHYIQPDNVVVEAAVEAEKGQMVSLPVSLYWSSNYQVRATVAKSLDERGGFYFVIGLCILPAALVLAWFFRKILFQGARI